MREENEFMKQYGAEDFRRYHSGEMPEQEMYALEKASLEDPFLADALEGYAISETPVADINELKQKIGKQDFAAKPPKAITNPFAMIAKVAAVLVIGSGLTWLIFHKKYPDQDKELAAVAKTEKQHVDSLVAAGLDPALASTNNGTLKVAEPTTEPATYYSITDTVSNGSTAALSANSEVFNKKGEATYSFSVPDSAKYFANVTGNNNLSNNANNALAGKLPGASVKNIPVALNQLTFKGRVVDSKGNPVAFASLVDQADKKGFMADADGRFDFIQKDSVAVVDVSALGYKPMLANLKSSHADSNILVLQQADSKLNEVVITEAYSTKRKERENLSWSKGGKKQAFDDKRITVSNAIPENGWDTFYKYVTDSLKTIAEIDRSISSTEISISFDIDDKGKPINITAEKSLCEKCREEAIRVFKDGPAWKLNRKKKKARAIVRF